MVPFVLQLSLYCLYDLFGCGFNWESCPHNSFLCAYGNQLARLSVPLFYTVVTNIPEREPKRLTRPTTTARPFAAAGA